MIEIWYSMFNIMILQEGFFKTEFVSPSRSERLEEASRKLIKENGLQAGTYCTYDARNKTIYTV